MPHFILHGCCPADRCDHFPFLLNICQIRWTLLYGLWLLIPILIPRLHNDSSKYTPCFWKMKFIEQQHFFLNQQSAKCLVSIWWHKARMVCNSQQKIKGLIQHTNFADILKLFTLVLTFGTIRTALQYDYLPILFYIANVFTGSTIKGVQYWALLNFISILHMA